MNVTKLEPFGIFSLAASLCYSMIICLTHDQQTDFRKHFIVMCIFNLIALLSITLYKYLVHKFTCDKMNRLLTCMKLN